MNLFFSEKNDLLQQLESQRNNSSESEERYARLGTYLTRFIG